MNGKDPASYTAQDLADPTIDASTLAQLASSRPDLRQHILYHPNCYPELRQYIQEQSGATQAPPQASPAEPSRTPPAPPEQLHAPQQQPAQAPPMPPGHFEEPPQSEPSAATNAGKDIVSVLTMIPRIWKDVWKGAGAHVLDIPRQVGENLSFKHLPWLIVTGIVAIIMALWLLIEVATLPFSPPGSVYPMAFFFPFFFVFIAFFLRILTVQWTLMARGTKASLVRAGNIIAAAWSFIILLLIVQFFFGLLPGVAFAVVGFIVISLLGIAVAILSELLIFAGIVQEAASEKSPLVPHVMFTILYAFMVFIATLILSVIFGEMLADVFLRELENSFTMY